MDVHHLIGCSGFSNRDWKGFFYPDNLASKDYLKFYAEHFNAVEINSTFYRNPTAKTLHNWYSQTPAAFRFFVKIPQTISHINQLRNSQHEITEFCNHIKNGLKEKLGGFLFQFPPSYIYSQENLQNITTELNQQFLNVIEFRYKTWWNEAIFEALAKQRIIFCGVSIPKDIPEEVIVNHPSSLYYRLHGKPILFKSEYAEEELKLLAETINKSGRSAFIFFNNTWGHSAIKNALYLKKLLSSNSYQDN